MCQHFSNKMNQDIIKRTIQSTIFIPKCLLIIFAFKSHQLYFSPILIQQSQTCVLTYKFNYIAHMTFALFCFNFPLRFFLLFLFLLSITLSYTVNIIFKWRSWVVPLTFFLSFFVHIRLVFSIPHSSHFLLIMIRPQCLLSFLTIH